MSPRTLVILRHAKAASPDGVIDRERPLTERGHADAADAGAWLTRHGYVPDLVLCSPARRTRETWYGVGLALTARPALRYAEQLYSGYADLVLDLVAATDDDTSSLMLVGHNPTMSQLSSLLDPEAAAPEGLPTAGIAVHRFDGSWVECGPRRAPLAATYTARA